MSDIKNLRFKTYPVLPIAYDNSLSYYEVLSKVVEKINEIIELIDTLQDEDERITALETAVTSINKTITVFESRISTNEDNIQTNTDDIDSLNKLVDEINEDIKVINETIANYYSILNAKIDTQYDTLKSYTDIKVLACKNHCSQLIDTLTVRVKEMERIINSEVARNVYNYVANKNLSFKANNYKIYNDLENSISAEEYCRLGLTADDYADYEITAIDYIRDSKKRLHINWVYEPILGYRQEISNILTGVVNYFFGTIDADTYAGLNLNADGYAELGMTATEYRRYDTVPYGYNYDSMVEIVQNIVDSGAVENETVNNLITRVTALESANTSNTETLANNTAAITTLQTTAVTNNGTGLTSDEYSKLSSNL